MEGAESIRDMLERVGKSLPEHGDTFGCPKCLDRGYTLYTRPTKYRYDATYGPPCEACTLGEMIRKRIVRERAERETHRRPAPEKNKMVPLAEPEPEIDPDDLPF